MTFAILRSRVAVLAFVQVGLLLDSLFHIYRFHKIGCTSITGLVGQHQSIILSYCISAWALLPLLFCKRFASTLGKRMTRFWWFAAVALLLNQIAGRSVLKGMFDVMLVAVLFGWELIENLYARNRDNLKTDTQLQLVHSELMNLFQTTVVVVTFVISTFGFSFAPSYIQTYYSTAIGQPTVWWFGTMTIYLTCGVGFFISLRCWALAISKRRTDET